MTARMLWEQIDSGLKGFWLHLLADDVHEAVEDEGRERGGLQLMLPPAAVGGGEHERVQRCFCCLAFGAQ